MSSATGTPAGPGTPTGSAGATRMSSAAAAPPSLRSPTATSEPAATHQVVVRPVTSSGTLARGWSARSQNLTISCAGALFSPVAESGDVLYCSPSAASAIACWHASDRSYAYCLPDPRTHTVDRFRLNGTTFSAAHPAEFPPAPQALDLVDGTRCSIRIGGAAARLQVHPDWVPYYFCGAGEDTAVWAQQSAADGGVRRADGLWTVQASAADGTAPLRTIGVANAYFVATA